jgi:hypothetical protein
MKRVMFKDPIAEIRVFFKENPLEEVSDECNGEPVEDDVFDNRSAASNYGLNGLLIAFVYDTSSNILTIVEKFDDHFIVVNCQWSLYKKTYYDRLSAAYS